jgi:hypothetical protein
LFAFQVARQTGNVRDFKLRRHVTDDHGRHRGRIGQEGAQKPDGQDLESEAEAVGIAAALDNQLPVGVIDVELARELDRADLLGIPSIAALLRLGQKIDRHRGVSRNGRLMRRRNYA